MISIEVILRVMTWLLVMDMISSIYNVVEFEEEECDIVQHLIDYGSQVAGVGVYAGKNFDFEEEYEYSNIIRTKRSVLENTALDDFIEGYNDTHCEIVLGYSMIYNHVSEKVDKMVRKRLFYPGEVDSTLEDISDEQYTELICYAAREVKYGDQVLSDYGAEWFEFRTWVPEISPYEVGGDYVRLEDPIHAPSRVPGCPTRTTEVNHEPSKLVVDR